MTTPWIVSVIDDDEPVRNALAMALEAVGYKTATYLDADDFLARGREGCGVVVSDVRMPGTNGIELTRILRTEGGNTPVILMTGHADAALLAEAMSAGADALLSKPLMLKDMMAEIARTATVHGLLP